METQVMPSPAANAPSSNGYRESDDETSPPNQDSPTESSTESPEANGAILTISEAALALGISPAAVRRRIRSGKIAAQRQERPQGHIWVLSQESLSTYRQEQADENKQSSNGHQEAGADGEPAIGDALGNGHSNGPEMLLDMLRESRDEIRVLNKELRDVASAASMYQTRNEILEERLLLLQAPTQRRRWYNWPWTKTA